VDGNGTELGQFAYKNVVIIQVPGFWLPVAMGFTEQGFFDRREAFMYTTPDCTGTRYVAAGALYRVAPVVDQPIFRNNVVYIPDPQGAPLALSIAALSSPNFDETTEICTAVPPFRMDSAAPTLAFTLPPIFPPLRVVR
jgi:hypothetical protein